LTFEALASNTIPLRFMDLRPSAPMNLDLQVHSSFLTYYVGATGFEPATTPTPRECATGLRYAPIFCLLLGVHAITQTCARTQVFLKINLFPQFPISMAEDNP
jgi:hypothetical protein